jgi:hypothetical protein
MSHQDGFGNNGAESTGSSKPDDGDACNTRVKMSRITPDGTKLKADEFRTLAEFAYHRFQFGKDFVDVQKFDGVCWATTAHADRNRSVL